MAFGLGTENTCKPTAADAMKLKQLMYEHPAWIICSPEYNASYPALLKNTIDWASSPVKSDPAWHDEFKFSRGKVAGMLSASPDALINEAHRQNVQAVIDQMLFAAQRLAA